MKETYFLAIDIGASSGRHILGHLSEGKLVIEEIYRFKNSLLVKDGHLVWDIKRLYKEILQGLKKAHELQKEPAYVGIDTWGVDYVLLDEKNQVLGNAYGYRDSRTQNVISQVHSLLPFENLYARTGIQFQPFNTIYQLYCDKLSGKLVPARRLLMLPDYVNFLLSGKQYQEYTNATTTGLINAKTRGFDSDILSALGYPPSLFAPLRAPLEVIGSFQKEVAAEVGYSAKVVLPCTHDTASAVLALPSLEAAPYISSGTWSLLGIEHRGSLSDERSRQANFTNEGSIDGRIRYQKNIMGLWMIQRVKEEAKDLYDFAELASLARQNPVSETVDVNDERFLAPKNMSQEIMKAVGRSLTIGEMAYIIFHSLALSYGRALQSLEQGVGQSYSTLHIIGGGSKNLLLNELTAQATRKRIVSGPSECTAIGNLIAQLWASGQLSDEKEAKKLIMNSFDIEEVKL